MLKHDDTFDSEAYDNYSPLYLPATYAMTYLLAFALSTCVIVHTLLYHGRTLLNGLKKMRVESDDIHAKLMRNYPEVPDWWYASAFCVFFSLAVVAVEVGCVASHSFRSRFSLCALREWVLIVGLHGRCGTRTSRSGR